MAACVRSALSARCGRRHGRRRAGRRRADRRRRSTAFALLRDQVRGTFAFNRTSLAGHLVGARR